MQRHTPIPGGSTGQCAMDIPAHGTLQTAKNGTWYNVQLHTVKKRICDLYNHPDQRHTPILGGSTGRYTMDIPAHGTLQTAKNGTWHNVEQKQISDWEPQ
jgi:hypothetical protein